MLNYIEIYRGDDKKLHDNILNNSVLTEQFKLAKVPGMSIATRAAINNSAVGSISPVTLNVKSMMKAGDTMKSITGITASAAKALQGEIQ